MGRNEEIGGGTRLEKERRIEVRKRKDWNIKQDGKNKTERR